MIALCCRRCCSASRRGCPSSVAVSARRMSARRIAEEYQFCQRVRGQPDSRVDALGLVVCRSVLRHVALSGSLALLAVGGACWGAWRDGRWDGACTETLALVAGDTHGSPVSGPI